MAVYERRYKRYEDELMPQVRRFWVIPRYAIKDVFQSKLFVAFFALSFIYPVFKAAIIYLLHNADFLAAFPNFQMDQIFSIDGGFFRNLMNVQIWFAFLIALFIGPGLISKDLANNSLPLYLSRPFSRSEYVIGKITILAFLLSLVTWGVGFFLFFLQGNFEGFGWMVDNLGIILGVFIGSWLWIITVSLLALALSAWVKWRPVAAFMMLMVFLTGSFFGVITNALFDIEWAGMINMALAIDAVWVGLFGITGGGGVPPLLGWLALLGLSAVSLLLLHLKVRAYEVVS